MDCAGAWNGEELENPRNLGLGTLDRPLRIDEDVRMTAFRADNIGYFNLHLDEAMSKTGIVQVG